jgi:NADPH:quinone reductase-like Zn-dependent oxidoreductase
MKAALYRQYGSPAVIQIEEIEKPIPKDDEILIKIHATTVSAADWRARSLIMPPGFGPLARLIFGFSKPRQPILGGELSGVVEATGKDVTRFKPGDKIFADCGFGFGAHAAYKTIKQDGTIALKPENLSFEEAAALCFGGATALYFLRDKAKIQPGEKILINGASGAVGTAMVQIARSFGADVTGVCSTDNLELVKSIGATKVIDYTKEDFVHSGQTYDIVVDTVGSASWARCKDALTQNGRLILVACGLAGMLEAPFVSKKTGKSIIAGPAETQREHIEFLANLAKTGHYKPVIDKVYPFEEIIAAHAYVDTGRKKGNVVVTL